MKTVTFFNNKGGVGKTTMVYNIAWMLSEMGKRVIIMDLDPQSNLSALFLDPERLDEILLDETESLTVLDAITPITEGNGYSGAHIEKINENIGLVVGNLSLSTFEDKLSDAWLKCLDGDIYSFKIISIFHTIIQDVCEQWKADLVLVDVGPNLGAINRAVLVSTSHIVIPVGSDLFSLQGVKNLGTTLKKWQGGWGLRASKNPKPEKIIIPHQAMKAIGYVVMQYTAKESRPVKSYLKWANRIPKIYEQFVLDREKEENVQVEDDPNCIGLLKHYRSLAPMSMEARKPIFLLKPADGAIGAHVYAVRRSYEDFEKLTLTLLKLIQIKGVPKEG